MTASPVRKMRLELIRAAFAVACCPEAHRLVKSQSRGLENIELPAQAFDRLVAAVDAWRRIGAQPVPPPKKD